MTGWETVVNWFWFCSECQLTSTGITVKKAIQPINILKHSALLDVVIGISESITTQSFIHPLTFLLLCLCYSWRGPETAQHVHSVPHQHGRQIQAHVCRHRLHTAGKTGQCTPPVDQDTLASAANSTRELIDEKKWEGEMHTTRGRLLSLHPCCNDEWKCFLFFSLESWKHPCTISAFVSFT